jgi:hypothetical protein
MLPKSHLITDPEPLDDFPQRVSIYSFFGSHHLSVTSSIGPTFEISFV